jgi:hypothetical protein
MHSQKALKYSAERKRRVIPISFKSVKDFDMLRGGTDEYAISVKSSDYKLKMETKTMHAAFVDLSKVVIPIIEEIFEVSIKNDIIIIIGKKFDVEDILEDQIGYNGNAIPENKLILIGLYDYKNIDSRLNVELLAHEAVHVGGSLSRFQRSVGVNRTLDEAIAEFVGKFVVAKLQKDSALFPEISSIETLTNLSKGLVTLTAPPSSISHEKKRIESLVRLGFSQPDSKCKIKGEPELLDLAGFSRRKIAINREIKRVSVFSRDPEMEETITKISGLSWLEMRRDLEEKEHQKVRDYTSPFLVHFYGPLFAVLCTYAVLGDNPTLTVAGVKEIIKVLRQPIAAFEAIKQVDTAKFIYDFIMPLRLV